VTDFPYLEELELARLLDEPAASPTAPALEDRVMRACALGPVLMMAELVTTMRQRGLRVRELQETVDGLRAKHLVVLEGTEEPGGKLWTQKLYSAFMRPEHPPADARIGLEATQLVLLHDWPTSRAGVAVRAGETVHVTSGGTDTVTVRHERTGELLAGLPFEEASKRLGRVPEAEGA